MATEPYDFSAALRPGLPAPAAKPDGKIQPFNFTGGNNDPDGIPVDDLVEAATRVLKRDGPMLAVYGPRGGAQGYLPLRQFLAAKLKRTARIQSGADEILLTTGSLQGLDLVNTVLLQPGDVVLVEEATFAGALGKLARAGAKPMGIPMGNGGMRMGELEKALEACRREGTRPKYIYVIPTIQNPTATVMSESDRLKLITLANEYDVPIVEDDCYADLTWENGRPPAIYALDTSRRTIHIGSFSKTVAPALRVGYIVAGWTVLSRMMACKGDAGSGALEQMILAEYCAAHFDGHVAQLTKTLERKLDVLIEALNESFGTSAEFVRPPGGIFLWIKLPDKVDTSQLAKAAALSGVVINPGREWSTAGDAAKNFLRICYAHPNADVIRRGVAELAEVCHREFGVPSRISNRALT